ncbi:MAG: DUF1178 family protein [Hyphomicrobiaceae bacterium]|nr:DUF1178 family protein [Hyphomicrobiaceae bacterium]
MIKYVLRCAAGHEYEAWFAGMAAFDTLSAGGHLMCEVCGSAEIERAPMAPAVARRDRDTGSPEKTALTDEAWSNKREVMAKLKALREQVLAASEYVGPKFAEEARAIHDAAETGEAPPRAIHGEASADEVRGLIEDGIPVAPIPKLPDEDKN